MSLPGPYYNDDKNSFAYPTVNKRWPTIIDGMISDVQYAIDNNGSTVSGKKLIDELNQLNKDLVNDEIVRSLPKKKLI